MVQTQEQISILEAIIAEQNEVIKRYSSSETICSKPTPSLAVQERTEESEVPEQVEEMITSLMTKFNLKG